MNKTFLLLSFTLFACLFFQKKLETEPQNDVVQLPKETKIIGDKEKPIVVGAARFNKYFLSLSGKRVGVVTNQTGVIPVTELLDERGKHDKLKHTVDFLLGLNFDIKTIFAPEHGFRGLADAGEIVKDGKDIKTGLPIISLYGSNKKPKAEQIKDLDVIVFDIQDVGVRFYTYISTLAYVMEAAAENNVKVIVLDRPNPNGHYVDGPVLDEKFSSFVGLHPVPVVYGMTIGEYAKMVNEEKWLKNGVMCDLTVIKMQNYTHDRKYSLPVKPSPNLPNDQSINLYPSLCFFEGTNVSIGRGTEMQFQIYGSPYFEKSEFSFTPKPNFGAKTPKHNGKTCYGIDLREQEPLNHLHLDWLIDAYQKNPSSSFFNQNLFFDKLAGSDELRKQIRAGKSEKEIRASWEKDLDAFKKIRDKYLLYP